jgi:hypothetical protein
MFDPQVAELIAAEERRQHETLCLIPSENHVSPAVLAASGSVLTTKYSEGYPGRRYYQGNAVIDGVCNYNAVPFDTRKPMDPSGIRPGTPAVTTRDLGAGHMGDLARRIDEAVAAARRDDEATLDRIPRGGRRARRCLPSAGLVANADAGLPRAGAEAVRAGDAHAPQREVLGGERGAARLAHLLGRRAISAGLDVRRAVDDARGLGVGGSRGDRGGKDGEQEPHGAATPPGAGRVLSAGRPRRAARGARRRGAGACRPPRPAPGRRGSARACAWRSSSP